MMKSFSPCRTERSAPETEVIERGIAYFLPLLLSSSVKGLIVTVSSGVETLPCSIFSEVAERV